jgi:hypothetical protein
MKYARWMEWSSKGRKMNEAYLTGEPFEIAKAPGSNVLPSHQRRGCAGYLRGKAAQGFTLCTHHASDAKPSRKDPAFAGWRQAGALYTPAA